eukprot:7602915-Pyramimonas_sp.AAC.1
MLDVDGERRLEKAKFEAGLKEGRSASEAAMQSKRAGVVARLRTQLGENYSKVHSRHISIRMRGVDSSCGLC